MGVESSGITGSTRMPSGVLDFNVANWSYYTVDVFPSPGLPALHVHMCVPTLN